MPEVNPNLQDIVKSQGTRLQDLPPWMTYAAQFEEKLDPRLEEEVKRYSEKRHEKSSSQNEEELARWKEGNDEVSKQYQFIHPSEYADEGPRVGKIMHSSELINKLRNECNLQCWYREHPQPRKVTLLVRPKGGGINDAPQIGCWAQLGYMPEYSMVRFDEHGVPLDEKFRGWRTVLLQLILKGYLTEAQTNKFFGEAKGPASKRYLSTLKAYRDAGNII